jgi:uncharacterized protein (TIGR02246 family)
VKRFLTALAVVLTVLIAVSIAAPIDNEAQAAANAMVNRFVDSWNRADGAAYGENYWPEAELVDPSGQIVSGKAAIVQEHIELWAGPFKGTHTSGKVRRIQKLGSNYMIVDFNAELSGVRQLPPGTTQSGNGLLCSHLKHVMEKRSGVWKVLSAQNTFTPCQ